MCVNADGWPAASTARITTTADLINTNQGERNQHSAFRAGDKHVRECLR